MILWPRSSAAHKEFLLLAEQEVHSAVSENCLTLLWCWQKLTNDACNSLR